MSEDEKKSGQQYAQGALSAIIEGYREELKTSINGILLVVGPEKDDAFVSSSLSEEETYLYVKSMFNYLEAQRNEHD